MLETTIIPAKGATEPQTASSEPRCPALEAVHLSLALVGKVLVDNVGVEGRVGEVLAVVGPSGAGKSSFLRLLNRLDEPSGGTVRLVGRDYRELEPRDLRRRVGMVMQSANLFPGTVAANIAFPSRRQGACGPD
jgi:putative ABC transport system ATP-binding protein